MIFKICFIKMGFSSVIRRGQFAAWLVRKYNAGKTAYIQNSHLTTPMGSSVYGVLISSDTARHWL